MVQAPHPHAVQLLRELHLGSHVAACLAYLGSIEEATTKEICEATRLRQPHVSAALKGLEERGWIRYRVVKSGGAGRPRHVYRLTKDLEKILVDVKQQETKRYERVSKVVDTLQRFRGWQSLHAESAPVTANAHARDVGTAAN